MLSELRIRNFALIDHLTVRLGPGLNVLSGETGAGKSIIVGALSLLLGERASADTVRAGEERASVEGVFELEGEGEILRLLDERGIEAEDRLLVLKREVAVTGRNRAWINGSPATASVVGELGRALVDLHGQHEHQTLLGRDEQRAVLDAYAGNEAVLDRVRDAHGRLGIIRDEIIALEGRRREAAQRADFLRFQADEIEAAALRSGEEEDLDEEARRLSHSEELTELSSALYTSLSATDGALVGRLGGLRRSLEQLTRIDASQGAAQELYDTAYYALQELGERMETYASSIEHDPLRLDEIRRRQDLLFRLKSKYGPELEDVIRTGETVRAELDLLDGAEFELGGLRKRLAEAEMELQGCAAELTRLRTEAMKTLGDEVTRVLPDLGIAGGRFEAVALPLSSPASYGAEEIEFRIALNKGFDPRPLSYVASGGELSRIMLAIKTILARLDAVPTLIFDEVDAGIGGKVALQVGDKMREVAASHQVFAITHLPQIASRAHLHLLVSKDDRGGRTTTEVRPLQDQDRVREIARMLGGDPESNVSLEHARELIVRGVGAR